MLIDRSYFIGDLNIPNTGNNAVGQTVDWFIEKFETEFLENALSYPLYKALKAGLQVLPVEQRWTDLVEGVEYTDAAGRLQKWRGLVSQPPTVLNSLDALNTITIRPGGSGTYDPVAGQNTTTVPAALVGKDFIVEQRGVGQLRTDEYSIVGSTLTLTSGVFAGGDTYFFKSATLAINTSTGVFKQSPIANYVYYHFMENSYTHTTGMGEKKTAAENATVANPVLKMVRAWNEMSRWVIELRYYLRANSALYPEWQNSWFCYGWGDPWIYYALGFDGFIITKSFRPINSFGI